MTEQRMKRFVVLLVFPSSHSTRYHSFVSTTLSDGGIFPIKTRLRLASLRPILHPERRRPPLLPLSLPYAIPLVSNLVNIASHDNELGRRGIVSLSSSCFAFDTFALKNRTKLDREDSQLLKSEVSSRSSS